MKICGAACRWLMLGKMWMPKLAQASQGEIWWVNLDPTLGHEINKRRPCLIVSPNEINQHLLTVIAAPITSTIKPWPTRLTIKLQRQNSSVALDQIRAIDRARLIKKITTIDPEPALAVLREMFECV
jgi:mRNA interferase MazF